MKQFMAMISVLMASWAIQAFGAAVTTLVPAQSNVTFVSHQMGVDVPGKFSRFSAAIRFDPAAPQTGSAQIKVNTGSVDAGSVEANGTLESRDWFDVQDWPQASFVSTSLVALGGGRYRADGNLSIKGISRPVEVVFRAVTAGTGLALDGDLPISRAAYRIGGGEWADPSVVADEVHVHFHLVLK